MTQVTISDHKFIEAAIADAIKAEVDRMMSAQIDEMHERLADALRQSIGKIVLGVLTMYTVERVGHNIVITVNGKLKNDK